MNDALWDNEILAYYVADVFFDFELLPQTDFLRVAQNFRNVKSKNLSKLV